MRINSQQGIYLAALLHDIGKFWQRSVDNRKVLKQETLQMEGSICPTGKSGFATHIHALFTSEFIENYSSIFPQQFEHSGNLVQLGNLSARHHKRNLNQIERIIQYADNLSSGHDRRDEAEDVANDTGYKYKKIPLLNPFDTVFSIKKKDERSYFPVRPLIIDESTFANREMSIDESKQDDYARLWKSFQEDIQTLPTTGFSEQAATLLSLLKKYTWCIPSATNSMPDISLYDHLKTTAAIASCLYATQALEEFFELPRTFEGLVEEEKKRFVLIAGDFSGIQNFIYQLSSKGAAKTLKGRSFYLNLVQDIVLDKCKSLFEVEDAHILMETGGRFQVLLPNDKSKISEFMSFIAEVNRELRSEYNQALYIAVGTYPFPAKQFLYKNGYSEVVKHAYKDLERDKNRKYADIIDDEFFKPLQVAGATSEYVCHVTGMDLQEHQRKRLEEEENVYISKKVYEQIKLGRWLRNSRYMVKIRKDKPYQGSREIMPLAGLSQTYPGNGLVYRFFTEEEKDQLKKTIKEEPVTQIVTFNDTDFCGHSSKQSNYSSTFRFYGASWTPDDRNGKTVEFTDIANDDVNNLMAVLRMDVDNLGELFRTGFTYTSEDLPDKHLGSISRYSSMSEKLDLFFSGYLNHLMSVTLKEENSLDKELSSGSFYKEEPRQHIMPVYAGGDDVFIICRWDIAPQLAYMIHKKFGLFTNEHPKISISGGVSMVHGKYPIHKAAKDAEDAEKRAKTLPALEKPDGKDAFCMFDQALSWDDFERLQSYVKQIMTWQNDMKSRAILGFLRNLYAEYTAKLHFGRWRWRSAYRLKRIGKAYNNEESMAELASWLFNGSFRGEKFLRVEKLDTNYIQKKQPPELVDLTGMALRWVQSLTRNQQ